MQKKEYLSPPIGRRTDSKIDRSLFLMHFLCVFDVLPSIEQDGDKEGVILDFYWRLLLDKTAFLLQGFNMAQCLTRKKAALLESKCLDSCSKP